MPTPQTATSTTIMSRIREVPIEVPLVHANAGARVMIGLPDQHTQGACPMKAARRWRTQRIAGLAMLLPFALVSTAQDALPVPQPTLTTVVPHPAPNPPVAPGPVASLTRKRAVKGK